MYGPWFGINKCVSCHRSLTDDEEFYSKGICPKCGYKDKSACTIVATYTKIYRKVYTYTPKWYEFWKEAEWHLEEKKEKQVNGQ